LLGQYEERIKEILQLFVIRVARRWRTATSLRRVPRSELVLGPHAITVAQPPNNFTRREKFSASPSLPRQADKQAATRVAPASRRLFAVNVIIAASESAHLPETFSSPVSLPINKLNKGDSVLWMIPILIVAVAYEAFDAASRFVGLTPRNTLHRPK
jgi:hypothetical protein